MPDVSFAYWTHRTKTGRVVYDRPTNPFKMTDVARILKAENLSVSLLDEKEDYGVAAARQLDALFEAALLIDMLLGDVLLEAWEIHNFKAIWRQTFFDGVKKLTFGNWFKAIPQILRKLF